MIQFLHCLVAREKLGVACREICSCSWWNGKP